ncbi:MAG: CBS domain-containing membrane protein [Porticoccus sp.]|jgi:CBS domain-containing membrane protein
MLIFGLPHSPVSRPGHLFGGHLVPAVVGVTCQKFIRSPIFASSLAIAVAMLPVFFNTISLLSMAIAVASLRDKNPFYPELKQSVE